MGDSVMILSNYRYNRIGGVDADRELDSGEIVPYTLSEDEIAELDGVEIAPFDESLSFEVRLNEANYLRKLAYTKESDPIYMEAKFDNDEELMQKWRDKVEEIKLRIPLPVE